jgi:hypothetical protein
MMRHLPNRLTEDDLLRLINSKCAGTFDYFYMPVDAFVPAPPRCFPNF